MLIYENIENINITTPAFVINEGSLLELISYHQVIKNKIDCKHLFPLKSFLFLDTLEVMKLYIDGFSTSSLFEAKPANEILQGKGTIHFTSPGLRPDEFQEIANLTDYITFNSLSQLDRFINTVKKRPKLGLRINPQLSLVKDKRYDPCRKHSKLGVPLNKLVNEIESKNKILNNIEGIHFHTNCDSEDFEPLLKTALHIEKNIPDLLKKIKWINLGGGYLFEEAENLDPFYETIKLFREKYNLEVFIEPGAGIIRNACHLVSSVIDLFDSEGKTIAVLDTTVNHLPEVFEYQYHHEVYGEDIDGKYEYILAGSSCLAGDKFGVYRFNEPLDIGSKVIFLNTGAYSLVKAHMFNGINLPSIYCITPDGKIELKRKFVYNDFLSKWQSQSEVKC